MRVAILSLLLIGAPAGALAAGPSPTPPFPTVRDDVTVFRWLRANTSLRLGQSVAFAPDSVLVVLSDAVSNDTPGAHRITFRQEATAVGFVARTGGRSLRGEADVDCTAGAVRQAGATVFSGSDFRGEVVSTEGADTAWRSARPGSSLALAMGQVCAKPATAPTPNAAPDSSAAPAATPPPAPRSGPGEAQASAAQIGAFKTPDQAQQALDRLSADPAVRVRPKRIEPAIAAGALYYRALIAFPSKAAARAFCAAIIAKGQGCIVR